MKKLTSILIIASLLLISCGDKKKEEAPKSDTKKIEKIDDVAVGKKLFSTKGCMACHNETSKIVGPPVNEIASIYKENSGDIFKFLKGESEAIVDTDETQVAIMKNNIDTMLKEISDDELVAIVAYMNSVK